MHGRAQIRAALVTALTPALTGTFYSERAHRLEPGLLPAILLRMGEDSAQDDQRTQGVPFTVERQQTITIELHAAGANGGVVASSLDAMDAEVEQLIAAEPSLEAIVELIAPSESAVEMNVEQDRVLGVRVVTYIATWRHAFGAPETPEG